MLARIQIIVVGMFFFCVAAEAASQNCNCGTLPAGEFNFYVDAAATPANLTWCQRINNINAPYRTLAEARDAIRSYKTQCLMGAELDRDITVWIRGGVYEMFETTTPQGVTGEDTFELEAQDSGNPIAGYYITYRAYQSSPQFNPEDVLLTGGVEVDGWTAGGVQSDDAGGTMSRWWGTLNIDWPTSDIYIDNERMTLAREPDLGAGELGTGFAYILKSKVHDDLGPTDTFERSYEIDDGLRMRGSAACGGGNTGYIEAVAIHEWNVHRSMPLGTSTFAGPGGTISGNATLIFSPDAPLGKIGGAPGCTEGAVSYYPAFFTIRGRGLDSHSQMWPDVTMKTTWPTGFEPHAPNGGACELNTTKDDRLFVEGDKRFMDQQYEWYQAQTSVCQQVNIRLPHAAGVDIIDPNTATTILPKQQTLVRLTGSQEAPVKGVIFLDLMFGFTNYVRPGLHDETEYTPQSISSRGIQHIDNPWTPKIKQGVGQNVLPAAFEAKYVEGLYVVGCRFAHTGGNAINAFTPVRPSYFCGDPDIDGILVQQTEFFDIGGTALALSKFDEFVFAGVQFDAVPSGPEAEFSIHSPANVIVSANYFHDIGVRYYSSAAIWCRGTQDVEIYFNEIDGSMDSGIYGGVSNQMVETTIVQDICGVIDITETCGRPATGVDKDADRYTSLRGDFIVLGNRVLNTMGVMTDGAAIYLRGSPGQTCYPSAARISPLCDCDGPFGSCTSPKRAWVAENYVDDVAPNGRLPNSNAVAHLYFDNCSANWFVQQNVFLDEFDRSDIINVQVSRGIAESGQAALPITFCWDTNYYEGPGVGEPREFGRAFIEDKLIKYMTCTDPDGTDADAVLPAVTMQFARDTNMMVKQVPQDIIDAAAIPSLHPRVKGYQSPLIHP
ncbi:MAG: hypothetical protein NCW75_09290 [Phycisphaera sp.]|nr:MAG: hypothetical protein NCW75_09290 [Phycisphaera sp.]